MSGCFDHMYIKDAEELLAMPRVLERMNRHLLAIGAHHAAARTREILDTYIKVQHIADRPGEPSLRDVWRVVERELEDTVSRKTREHVVSRFEEQRCSGEKR